MSKRVRIPEVVHLPVQFQTGRGHVVAIYHINGSTLGVRFESPEQMLTFFTKLMEKAVKVWPDHPLVKEYLSDE
jgi:hypothetical protein